MKIEILAHNSHTHSTSFWETVRHFLSDGVHLTTILLLVACLCVLVWKMVKSKADQ